MFVWGCFFSRHSKHLKTRTKATACLCVFVRQRKQVVRSSRRRRLGRRERSHLAQLATFYLCSPFVSSATCKSPHICPLPGYKHTQNPASLPTFISSDLQTNLSPLTASLYISQSVWGIFAILCYYYNMFANYISLSAFSLSGCHNKSLPSLPLLSVSST